MRAIVAVWMVVGWIGARPTLVYHHQRVADVPRNYSGTQLPWTKEHLMRGWAAGGWGALGCALEGAAQPRPPNDKTKKWVSIIGTHCRTVVVHSSFSFFSK